MVNQEIREVNYKKDPRQPKNPGDPARRGYFTVYQITKAQMVRACPVNARHKIAKTRKEVFLVRRRGV